MRILAIETSCDDTSVSIIEASGKTNPRFLVLADFVSSQIEIHRKWGGVYPALAKREHQKNLIPTLTEALEKAKLLKIGNNPKVKNLEDILSREQDLLKDTAAFLEKYEKPNIDLIVITNGPGLEPCLWVGVNFAKALSMTWDLPIIPINHIKAHILANWLPNEKIKLPAICLVVSGGHTQIVLMKKINQFKILGETRDDAAGECLDKTAKILGLEYPGGPIIAQRAQLAKNPRTIELPRPMISTKDYEMSFSGLKTAVLYKTKNEKNITEEFVNEMCREAQQAVIDVLIKKTLKATKDFKVKSVIMGGGVAANEELRKQFKERIEKDFPKIKFFVPERKYCTDNASMAAVTGYFEYLKRKKYKWEKIEAEANQQIN